MKSVDIDTKDGMKVIVFAFDRVCFETMVFPHTVGHECMAFAIHQLGITDARYFGFRHVTNDVRVEWIDLNKPLGTQLDKHCSQHCFYFGVMYYISRAYNIKDEAALYQYFRQLHVDYLYSQYDCLLERAIKLASFYLRVILGPYDPKTHTVTTVGRHLLFPASIRRDEKIATAAQEKAFQNYQTLHISSTTSMVFYIIEFESATYYGLECHPAILSESREAVHLITSYNGIMVKYLRSPDAFLLKWSDIAAVTRSQKSSIIIQQLSRSIQLELADKKRAKYFFQMAFLLMHFYQDNPEFCDRSTKEPAKPDGYESYSLLLSSSQSETLRSVLRYQQSLTSIPDNVRSSPKSLYEATETAQYLLAQPSRPEQTALGATEAITSPLKPLTSVSAAEIRLDEELFLTGSKDIKYEAKKLNKSSQTQSFYISMINERFQKYTETSPMHLLSQTLKNILQYLDAIEKAEGETQADVKSKQSTEKHFPDSQPLKESGIPYRYPPKYPFPKTKSKDTDIDPAKPITVGQILKRVQDLQVRDKSTESVSPAKLEKSKESKVSETQTMLPSRKYTYLEPAVTEPTYQALSKSELLALESSKGAVHKHSKKPFIMVASGAFKDIRSRDKYENLQRKLNEGEVFTEFRSTGVKSQMLCSVGCHVDNLSRNRYQSIVPYDENRVQLSGRPDNMLGYINASSIKWRRGLHKLSFIAAQAPLKNTVEDFWQMIWEQKVSIIIMLNARDDEDKLLCCQYWPQEWNLDQKFQSGPFTVTFHTYRRTPEYFLDVLTITNASGEQQLISNLYFTQWSGDDCPCDLSIFVSILEEIDSVQNLMRTKDPVQAPIAVLCHDGVGRTGVLIMSYIMKYCLKHDIEMNISHLLGFLRSNRMFMVTSLKQYISVHEALIYFLKGLFAPSKSYLVGPFRI